MYRKGTVPGLSPFKNTEETESTQQEKQKSQTGHQDQRVSFR